MSRANNTNVPFPTTHEAIQCQAHTQQKFTTFRWRRMILCTEILEGSYKGNGPLRTVAYVYEQHLSSGSERVTGKGAAVPQRPRNQSVTSSQPRRRGDLKIREGEKKRKDYNSNRVQKILQDGEQKDTKGVGPGWTLGEAKTAKGDI